MLAPVGAVPAYVACVIGASAAPAAATAAGAGAAAPQATTAAVAAAGGGGAAAAQASSSSCSGAPDPFEDTLAKHNSYRATHQAPAMAWDATVAAGAAAWASACSFGHDPNNNYGENIYAASKFAVTPLALSKAVDAWYGEVSSYSFTSPGFSSSTGHFTQVVWKGSVGLGCAYAACGASFAIANGIFVVCRYSPAGNMMGDFANNVLAPVGAVPAYVACAIGAAAGNASGLSPGSSGSATATTPAPTPAPGAFPVSVRFRSVIHGCTLATFRRDLLLAALAKTLSVDLGRVSMRSLEGARRQAGGGGGVAATADVAYPSGTNVAQVGRAWRGNDDPRTLKPGARLASE